MFALPELDPCYVYEIVAGTLDRWNVIHQTDSTLTILNGRQYEIGQCMVLPVRHSPAFLDLSDDEAAAVMSAARRLAGIMISALSPDGVLLYQNNGVGSGQELPHFHLHGVPRRQGSNWGFGPPHIAKLEAGRRPAYRDYSAVTDEKRGTAEQLRQHYGRSEQ